MYLSTYFFIKFDFHYRIWHPCIGSELHSAEDTLRTIKEDIGGNISLDMRIVDLSNDSRTTIDRNYFLHHMQLVLLIMNNNRAFSMPSDKPFLENRVVKSYFCNNCAITIIYNETFRGVPDLRNLELKNNKLQYIHKDAFEPTTKIGYINLEQNQLAKFNGDGILNHLTHLRTLLMSHNTQFAFTVNASFLQSLHLIIYECRNCNSHELSVNVFEHLPNLGYIDLRGQNITDIATDAFVKNEALHDLNLSENRWLMHWNFINENLRHLACNNCLLDTVTKEMVTGLPKLETLELRGNRISNIGLHTFDGNHHLSILLLDFNRLRTFPLHALNRMQRLKTLCLDHNPLIPSYNNTLLTELYVKKGLRDAKCSGMKHNYFETHLKEILFDDVKVIVDETDVFPYVDSQRNFVNLSDLNLYYVAPDVFRNFNLTTAIIEFNSMFNLQRHHPFLNQPSLVTLSLKHNNILDIYEAAFSHIPRLCSLDLSFNHIHSIANDAFINNLQIRHLNLSENNLTSLPYVVVDHLVQLTTLSLSGNRFFTIQADRIFLYQPNLLSFDCEHCMLSSIGVDTFSRMPSLERLSLHDNIISSLDDQAFQHNKRLKELRMKRNKIQRVNSKLWNTLDQLTELCLDFGTIELVTDCGDSYEQLKNLAINCRTVEVLKMWQNRRNECFTTTTLEATISPEGFSIKEELKEFETESFPAYRIKSRNFSENRRSETLVSSNNAYEIEFSFFCISAIVAYFLYACFH